MHPDEERLQRLLHGEFVPERTGEVPVREHVAGCAECRGRLARLEREEAEIHGLFRSLDHPAPAVSAQAVAARARGWRMARVRWAAGILLALAAAGAAYALPGSPFPGWTRQVIQWASNDKKTVQPPSTPEVAGIAFSPADTLTILFTAAHPDGRVRVRLGPTPDVRVSAPLGAATFTSDASRLVIENVGAATFDIEIPHNVPRVEIRVAGRPIFVKDGRRVTADGSGEARETYVLPLSAPTVSR